MKDKSLQSLSLTDRRKLEVSGVLEIVSYNGNLHIRGEGLEVGTAFSESGTVEISGYIRSMNFFDNKSRYADNIISRLFR